MKKQDKQSSEKLFSVRGFQKEIKIEKIGGRDVNVSLNELVIFGKDLDYQSAKKLRDETNQKNSHSKASIFPNVPKDLIQPQTPEMALNQA